MHALEEAIMVCNLSNPNSQLINFDPRVRAAMDYVCNHLENPITLSNIADAAGLSISRLSSLFRQHAGLSPMHYVETQRIDRARGLLELTSMSVKEVAHRVGFASPFYFSLRFKALTQYSPRSYRLAKARSDSTSVSQGTSRKRTE
jgi:AraC family transcriptional regulator of arabinose operon